MGHGPPAGAGAGRRGAIGGLTTGSVRTLRFTAPEPGGGVADHAYRTGAFRWALSEGVWGLVRVASPERPEGGS